MESRASGLRNVSIEDKNLTFYSWGYQVYIVIMIFTFSFKKLVISSSTFIIFLMVILKILNMVFTIVSKVGLLGEKLQLYTDEGSSKANWTTFNTSSQQLKWYKVRIKVCKEVYTPTKCLLFLLHYKTVTSLPIISRNLMRLRGVTPLH